MATKARILNIDIETSPNRVYTWGLFNQNIGLNQIEEPGEVLCFAARWYGENKTIFKSTYHDGKTEMVNTLWDLMDEADAVMGWNTDGFDVKHIKREFLEAGLLPPTEHLSMDLLKVARKNFKFLSNKLDFIAGRLDVGTKVKHSGFQLWRDVMAGDKKAWALFKRYNKQDVLLVEEAYEILKPWINTPTLNLAHFGASTSCPRCGSVSLSALDKLKYTKTSAFKQHRCDECGFVARERKAYDGAVKPNLV